MQQDSGHHAVPAWAQGWYRYFVGDEGPQALAILLTTGWSVLAAAARNSEEQAILGQQLHESMERLREEITRPIESLLGLARELLLSGRLGQSLTASFAQSPPHLHPNLGPLQKEQANLDALQRALNDYQAAASRYTHELGKLFEAALSEYQRELSANVRPESTSRTTRELHDLWIQVAEQTYERFLGSADHTRAIGGLMNAWAGLQLTLHPVVDEILRHMGLPSRRDVDEIQTHLDRLRRQQRADITRLEREITALRNELAARPDAAPEPPRKPPPRRSGRS